MSKKKIWIIIIAIVAILAISAVLLFLMTKDTVVEKEGLLQKTRVYVTDIRFENDRVHYTVVNKTFCTQSFSEYPYVQKYEDGYWKPMDVLGGGAGVVFSSCDAFSERAGEVILTKPEKMTKGIYRVVFGNIFFSEEDVHEGKAEPCIVGYFIIEVSQEEFGQLYTRDGFVQNTLINCMITKASASGVSYEIHNRTACRIYTNDKVTDLYKYQDGEWVWVPENEDHIVVEREPLGWRGVYKEIYEGDVYHHHRMGPGFYRIVVKMEVKKPDEGAKVEEMYAVAYFTLGDEVYGTFEEKDGILQNTNITLRVVNNSLVAPVDGVFVDICNESVFDIEPQTYADGNYDYSLEIFKDGVWQQAPSFGEVIGTEDRNMVYWTDEQIGNGAAALMDKRYRALEAGEYRARVKYSATCRLEGVEIPEGQLEAVAYFTVTAE